MQKWRLIDGFNMAFRAYHGMPDLIRSDGFPTGALHGWVRTLWKLEDLEGAAQTAVFFDLGGSARHRALLPEYKAQRDAMPDPMRQQLPLLKALVPMMGYRLVEREGVEADDLIGSAVAVLRERGAESVEIVSSDKDFGQLVGGNVVQIAPPPTANPKLGWRRWDADGIREKFGVPPEHVADFLAITGDVADNIGGLAGVGAKTAAKWIAEFGGIESLLKKWNWVEPARFRIAINRSRETLLRNLELVRLKCDFDVRAALEAPAAPNPDGLRAFFEEYEMKASARAVAERYGR